MEKSINQILFYTRNTEITFHLEMAKQLKAVYPNVNIRFITFFSWAANIAKSKGYTVFYMPHELQNVTGEEISDERFDEIDDQLYSSVGANFNLMLHSEPLMLRCRWLRWVSTPRESSSIPQWQGRSLSDRRGLMLSPR